MSKLETAVENVYSAFSDAVAPKTIAACPCCIDAETISRLLSTPLRAIIPDDIAPYASSAFLTVGDVDDYLYFLPRILEITVSDEDWWPTFEVTGRAIKETSPLGWPEAKQRSVTHLFDATVEMFVAQGKYYRIDEWVCGIARSGFDVGSILEIVTTKDEAISEYFNYNAPVLSGGNLGNSFWKDEDGEQDQIIAWLNSEKVRKVAFDTLGFTLSK